jgi:hypothetical protein
VQTFNSSIRTFPNNLTNNFLLTPRAQGTVQAQAGAEQAPKVNSRMPLRRLIPLLLLAFWLPALFWRWDPGRPVTSMTAPAFSRQGRW